MISLVTGENSFENERTLKKIVAEFNGTPERIDGSDLELKRLPDLLMGGTLFADKRLVIIKGLSESKTLWNDFADWLGRVSDDVHVVLVEEKPDKRTKTYKALQKQAEMYESKVWTERDLLKAEQWVAQEAKLLKFELDKKSAHTLVARVGADQWLLYQALQKLAALPLVTPEIIEQIVEANPIENVFNLFETALKGNGKKAVEMVKTLELSEDPYRLLGLISTQGFQLAVLATSETPSSEVAKDLAVHPFALQKLSPYAKKIGRRGAQKVIDALAEADEAVKTSAADPWLLLERTLVKIAQI